MRKIIISIGVVLFYVVISAPVSMAAQCPSSRVEKILGMKDDIPDSHIYMKEVINIIDSGITDAFSNSSGSEYLWFTLEQSIKRTAGIINKSFSTRTTTDNSKSLSESSMCLHIHSLLFEAYIEKIRCKLLEALEQNNNSAMHKLQSVLGYTEDRHNALRKGFDNPSYEDKEWFLQQNFLNPNREAFCFVNADECRLSTIGECAETYNAPYFLSKRGCELSGGSVNENLQDLSDDLGKLCPFHSNYLTPVSVGYGCHPEALNTYAMFEPVLQEKEAWEEFIEARKKILEDAKPLKEQVEYFEALEGGNTVNIDNFGYALTAEHKEIQGCIDTLLQNSGSGTISLSPLYSLGMTTTSPRGMFRFAENTIKLTRLFMEKWALLGSSTEQADYLKFAHEFPEDLEEKPSSIYSTISYAYFSRSIRNIFFNWNEDQRKKESAIFLSSHNLLHSSSNTMFEIHESIKKLSTLSSKKDKGVRLFGINLGVFLRKSCVFRPCNGKIEQSLKLLLEDNCFPYTDGLYLQSGSVVPYVDKCHDAL